MLTLIVQQSTDGVWGLGPVRESLTRHVAAPRRHEGSARQRGATVSRCCQCSSAASSPVAGRLRVAYPYFTWQCGEVRRRSAKGWQVFMPTRHHQTVSIAPTTATPSEPEMKIHRLPLSRWCATVWVSARGRVRATLALRAGSIAGTRALREQALGPMHPDTALSLNNLAGLLRAQGEYEAARPLYERALAICEDRLGIDHPTTRTIRANLAALDHPADRGGHAAG
jgi:hypothetical protein